MKIELTLKMAPAPILIIKKLLSPMLKKNPYRKCQIALTSRDLKIASALAKTN